MLDSKGIYAMYLRKSRADAETETGQFETLAHHEQILRSVAEREGIAISKVYKELVSGDTISDRPEMQSLLKDVRSGIYTGVLVTEVSRLARGRTADQAAVSEAFSMNGTLIITPSKIYNPADDADETFFDFELFMARQEYKYIRKRMKAGKDQSLKNGNYINWRAPLGFDKVGKTLQKNQDAPFVKMLLEDFANGTITISDVTRRLRAYTGKDSWPYHSAKYLLCNPAYCGYSELNIYPTVRYTKPDGTIGKKRVRNPNPDIVKGTWEGIISVETHERIKAKFGNTPKVTEEKDLKNPFAGVLRCAHCGKIMCYHFGDRKAPVVRHMWGTQNVHGCVCAPADIEEVVGLVCDAMEQKLKDVTASLVIDEEGVSTKTFTVQKEEAEKKRDSLYQYLESGIYTPEEFKQRRAHYTEQIEALEKQIEEIENRQQKPKILSITTADAIKGIRWKDCPASLRNEFFKSVFTDIEYWRDGKEGPIELTYHWRY